MHNTNIQNLLATNSFELFDLMDSKIHGGSIAFLCARKGKKEISPLVKEFIQQENLDSPARTIITSEGGQTPSRFKHIILDPWKEQYRTLTPEEVEKICGFPSGWTNTGMPDNWRYFCMGNALVVGLIEKMGKILLN